MDADHASSTGGATDGTVRIVRCVAASPDRTWRCLTHPDCFRTWWHEHVELDPREGGTLLAPWTDPEGRGRQVRAQVTTYHPPRGLVMVWADEDWDFDTVVSIWIETDGTGSRVTIEHQGWMAAPERERALYMQHHHDDWTRHLNHWAAHAEDTDAHAMGD